MSKEKDKLIGGFNCPYRIGAGSYYDPLPWCECSKRPGLVSNDCEMCDLDAGVECRFVKGNKEANNDRD